MGVGGQHYAPAALPPGKTRYPLYSTNILTEYFKHAAHSPFFFSLQDAVCFIMLSFFGSCNIHVLNTGCVKILKKIPAPKG